MLTLLCALVAFGRVTQAARIVDTLPADASADYVIVGGGLAGMVLANRLTASGEHSVIVLEAGPDVRYVDEVNDPFAYYDRLAQNNDYSWQWQTVNQTVGGARKMIAGGKALGGSTSINGMVWSRGTRSQYDSIAQLNNDPSFAWDNFLPYMTKAERFYVPSPEAQAQAGAYFDPLVHGYSGNVGVSHGQPRSTWNFSKAVTSAAQESFGLRGGDVASDDPNAAEQVASSVHPAGDTSVRSSSSNSYLYPLFPAHQNTTSAHPGLTVLPGHQATRLVWAAGGHRPVAAGVEYGAADGTGARAVVRARKEVLVCAGAIATPALLERSGVGARAALAALHITPVVDLPSVGTNLQDQALVPLIWSTAADVPTTHYPGDAAFPDLAQLIGHPAAADAAVRLHSTARARATAVVAAGGHTSASGLKRQFEMQAEQIAGGAPVGETSVVTGGGVAFAATWLLLPQYRGTVHINSTDPFKYPRIDPAYLTTDFDMAVLVAMSRGVRRMYGAPALRGVVGQEVLPGTQSVPANASDAVWAQFVAASYMPVYHPIGTAAMLPREDGGCVDTAFRLYGTANVRVVDASVLPLQLSAHLSATMYGIAEKAAETILRGR